MKILIQPPTYTLGSIGDNALMLSVVDQLKLNMKSEDISSLYYKIDNIFLENNINENIDDYKLLIFFGNDCLSYYSIRNEIINLFISKNKKVFILNTSYGKMDTISDKNKKNIKPLIENSNVFFYIRDIYSYNTMISNFNFKNTPNLCSDLAFTLQEDKTQIFYNQKRFEDLSQRILETKKNKKRVVVVNLHSAVKFPKTFQNIMNIIKKNYKHTLFIFLPHDTRSKEKKFMEELVIKNGLKNEIGKNILIEDVISPKIEKAILKDVDLVVTGRMHLAILALSVCKPVIGLAYNGFKMRGTFRWLNCEDLVINDDNQNIINIYHHVITNLKSIRHKISNNSKFAYFGALSPIKEILSYFNSNVLPNISINS